MLISELARLSGVSERSLRHYEQKGLIVSRRLCSRFFHCSLNLTSTRFRESFSLSVASREPPDHQKMNRGRPCSLRGGKEDAQQLAEAASLKFVALWLGFDGAIAATVARRDVLSDQSGEVDHQGENGEGVFAICASSLSAKSCFPDPSSVSQTLFSGHVLPLLQEKVRQYEG